METCALRESFLGPALVLAQRANAPAQRLSKIRHA
jgi:hypothetical protein